MAKGKTNNPRGRPKGAKNKATENLKNIVEEFLKNNFKDLQRNYNLLSPKDKLLFIEKLLAYTLPKATNNINVDILTENQIDNLINKINE